MESLDDSKDSGFTVLELMIVAFVMAIVLVAAGTSLISLSQATNRDDGLVAEEQAASVAVTQIVDDLRSAHAISIPNGAVAANAVLIQENLASGSTTQIEWIYTPAAGATPGTLTRYVQSSGGSLVASGSPVSGVANPSSLALFTYYGNDGVAIANTANVANCTTRVTVDLVQSAPKSAGSGVANFELRQDVALTDQLALLTQPGSVQC